MSRLTSLWVLEYIHIEHTCLFVVAFFVVAARRPADIPGDSFHPLGQTLPDIQSEAIFSFIFL
jgi:hypothetical protein